MLLFVLLIALTSAYSVNLFNEFTADVDIYDLGRMARGKNAGSWHRSLSKRQEVFYFLAMQPWRHLLWTECDADNRNCFRYIINEDATKIPKDDGTEVLQINDANDYCRKEYIHPMATYDIDWTQIVEGSVLESADINGITCFRHPAKLPLVNIWLPQQYTSASSLTADKPCRYDFVGGKSITFRSFNTFQEEFIKDDSKTVSGKKVPTNGYLLNKTRCNIQPSPNNVKTDIAIVLGIADTAVVQKVNSGLRSLSALSVQEKNIYYLKGTSLQKEAITSWESIATKEVSTGMIDALINRAKTDLANRVKSGAIERGTLIVLLEKQLSTQFDAEIDFDRNGITAHVIVYNPKADPAISMRAKSLLSVGEQYYEFSAPDDSTVMTEQLFKGVRANLTERCNRKSCNGFCDGRDRCTCPMCCENSCYFSYCDASTGTCSPWPKDHPKEKIECNGDCVGTKECIDLQGCVYKQYYQGCEPKAKCMTTYCDDFGKCRQRDACESDTKPSYQNKCWSYECDLASGNCKRKESGAECPKLSNLCEEHVCDANLKCTVQKKQCVKTSHVAEMDCYKAVCNIRTGQCEDRLSCDKYTQCGEDTGNVVCKCDASNGFKCSCTGTAGEGSCDFDPEKNKYEVCDSTGEKPKCITSPCNQDLYVDGCFTKKCVQDPTTKEYGIQWEEKDCTYLVEFVFQKGEGADENTNPKELCQDKYEKYCDGGECFGRLKDGESTRAGCGQCILSEPKLINGKKSYLVTYTQVKPSMPKCSNGKQSAHYEKYKDKIETDDEVNVKCEKDSEGNFKWNYYIEFSEKEGSDYCAGCYTDLNCYLATEYHQYTYNSETATCSYKPIKAEPECHECNNKNNGFVSTCEEDLEKGFSYLGSTSMKYYIPTYCLYDQCIPDPYFDCMSPSSGSGVREILQALRECSYDNVVKGSYHYSSLWNENNYYNGYQQSEAFMKEVNSEAYCEWYVEDKECHVCTLKDEYRPVPVRKGAAEEKKPWYAYDKCQELTDDLHNSDPSTSDYYYKCEPTTNECIIVVPPPPPIIETEESSNVPEVTPEEPPEPCPETECKNWYRNGNGDCVAHTSKCQADTKKYNDAITKYNTDYPNVLPYFNIQCGEVPCNEETQYCALSVDHDKCNDLYDKYMSGEQDFGCRKPIQNCNEDYYHCMFEEFKSFEDDTLFYTHNLTRGSLCHMYQCHEVYNETTKKYSHWWDYTPRSYNKLFQQQPASDCHIPKCNETSGEVYQVVRECQVTESFPTLTEAQAQCFYCKCSFQSGDMVLTMFSDTETETYELDACGNCIVRNRLTGEQVNEKVPCVLTAAVNLTGAIAGATVAASIVFGLVGAMLIVSIGAFQTYQLVTSAMKNVISTTLENPEFVAADNEATNALAD